MANSLNNAGEFLPIPLSPRPPSPASSADRALPEVRRLHASPASPCRLIYYYKHGAGFVPFRLTTHRLSLELVQHSVQALEAIVKPYCSQEREALVAITASTFAFFVLLLVPILCKLTSGMTIGGLIFAGITLGVSLSVIEVFLFCRRQRLIHKCEAKVSKFMSEENSTHYEQIDALFHPTMHSLEIIVR